VNKKRIFIDGQDGTTGIEIRDRLARRADIELLEIAAEHRKDPGAKRALASEADAVLLCLPDAAAVESFAVFKETRAKLIDASSAHRTADGFTYGLPELAPGQRDAIRQARFVSNPGCYPTGFLLALRPLVDAGVVPPDYPVTMSALSGYSGGGKKMIQAFAEHDHSGKSPDWAVRTYGIALAHKHVPEMRVHAKLAHAPVFVPAVGNYYKGMTVSVPLHVRALSRRVAPKDVHAILEERYANERFVRVLPLGGEDVAPNGYLSPVGCNDTNLLELLVSGHEGQILVTARLDNLGKGAAGAAVQNLNLMLGLDEALGLV
jgi:N-acetyl-gamma-glutamyl-phosphate reductase